MTLVDVPLVDTDSHVTEPPDLWQRFLPQKWRDHPDRPRVLWDEENEELTWHVGHHKLSGVAKYAQAGWTDYSPSHPKSLDDADPASWNPFDRLKRLDEYGLHAQVLYPNIVAFQTYAFIGLEPDLALDCVRAYNDFLADFASADPNRLIPVMMLPFWDIEASVQEIERAHDLGHKGILFASKFDHVGLPPVWDVHWDPIYELAQERSLSINFHIGFSEMNADDLAQRHLTLGDEHSRVSSVSMLGNARAIADITCSGLCARFPELKFVSVESGAAWLPYLAESLDWHWKNFGAVQHRPNLELPSVYLYRQVFGTFWFEGDALRRVADVLANNVMFETDFPHPTSLSPGPTSAAELPRVMADAAVEGLSIDVVRKIYFENAARVYGLSIPVSAAER